MESLASAGPLETSKSQRLVEEDSVEPSQIAAMTSIHELYHYTLRSLGQLTKRGNCERCANDSVYDPMKRCLSLLYMWAQGLDLKFLQNSIDRKTGLQKLVVSELAAIIAVSHAFFDDENRRDQDPVRTDIASFIDTYTNDISCTNDDGDSSSATSSDSDRDSSPNSSHPASLHSHHLRRLGRLRMHVQCLMDLLPTIEHCCNEKRSEGILQEVTVRAQDDVVSDVVRPYVMQVQDKFASIDLTLAKRLGEANWARYRRLQALKTAFINDVDAESNEEDREDDLNNAQSRNEATVLQPFSEFFDSGLGASIPAKSRYNPSVVSHTSLLSTQTAIHRGSLRVPPTPAEVLQGLPFICQICGTKLSHIKNRIDWKSHVFTDIQPYICTFTDCPAVRTVFPTRKHWATHEMQEHSRVVVWRCFRCNVDHDTIPGLLRHLLDAHAYRVAESGSERDVIFQAARTLVTRMADQICPMCKKTNFKDERDWTNHVARHMEEVALVALPRYSDFDDDDDDRESLSDDSDGDRATGVVTGLTMQAFLILPTREGFKTHARQLCPNLEPYLIDHIVKLQLERYERLSEAKLQHSKIVSLNRQCSSGALCEQLGGKPKILSSLTSAKDSSVSYPQFKVGSGIDERELAEGGILMPALFPSGIPLPSTTYLPAELECPLCFQVKRFQKPMDWTRHVHEDVRPFFCTFPHCPEPKSFKRKADWIRHENERHRHLEWWRCSISECGHTCYRKDNFVQHLIREHKMTEPRSRTQVSRSSRKLENGADDFWQMVETCRHRTSLTARDEPCKFCGSVCSTWEKLSTHVGKHMEQIALPVLGLVAHKGTSSQSQGTTEQYLGSAQGIRDMDKTRIVTQPLTQHEIAWMDQQPPSQQSCLHLNMRSNQFENWSMVKAGLSQMKRDQNELLQMFKEVLNLQTQEFAELVNEIRRWDSEMTRLGFLSLQAQNLVEFARESGLIRLETNSILESKSGKGDMTRSELTDTTRFPDHKASVNDREADDSSSDRGDGKGATATVRRDTSDIKSHELDGFLATSESRPIGHDTTKASKTWQEELAGECQKRAYSAPIYNVMSDNRGGRTAWFATVTINSQNIPARYWYSDKYLNNAKEDAAEVACTRLRNPARRPTLYKDYVTSATAASGPASQEAGDPVTKSNNRRVEYDSALDREYGKGSAHIISNDSEILPASSRAQGTKEETRTQIQSVGQSTENAGKNDLTSEEYDEHEYCYCNRVSYGEMIACDNPRCSRQWFHLGCVGLKEFPKTAMWYCKDCKMTLTEEQEPTASTLLKSSGQSGSESSLIKQIENALDSHTQPSASDEEFPDLFFQYDPKGYAAYKNNCTRSYRSLSEYIRHGLERHLRQGNVAREGISSDQFNRAQNIKPHMLGTGSTKERNKMHYLLVRQQLFGTPLAVPIIECRNKGNHPMISGLPPYRKGPWGWVSNIGSAGKRPMSRGGSPNDASAEHKFAPGGSYDRRGITEVTPPGVPRAGGYEADVVSETGASDGTIHDMNDQSLIGMQSADPTDPASYGEVSTNPTVDQRRMPILRDTEAYSNTLSFENVEGLRNSSNHLWSSWLPVTETMEPSETGLRHETPQDVVYDDDYLKSVVAPWVEVSANRTTTAMQVNPRILSPPPASPPASSSHPDADPYVHLPYSSELEDEDRGSRGSFPASSPRDPFSMDFESQKTTVEQYQQQMEQERDKQRQREVSRQKRMRNMEALYTDMENRNDEAYQALASARDLLKRITESDKKTGSERFEPQDSKKQEREMDTEDDM